MEQTPQAPQAPQIPMNVPGVDQWKNPHALSAAFEEYRFLAEGADKVTDRRQTVNTLFVTINALFLTGVGYLLLQYLTGPKGQLLFILGFLAIALVVSEINSAWLKLSESNRRLVDLRIRYLKQLEQKLREGGNFPDVTVELKPDEIGHDKATTKTTRGTYLLEDVLYNPGAKEQFSFSKAEQRIARSFTLSFWGAFVLVVLVFVFTDVLPKLFGIKLTLPF